MLRRPPRPPLPPSAHDMVREARLQLALAPHGIRLPPILAVCEDASVLGVPFYVMRFLEGRRDHRSAPGGARDAGVAASPRRRARRRPRRDPRGGRARPRARRVRAARELPRAAGPPLRPAVGGERHAGAADGRSVGRRLDELLPEPLPETVVHGDYRLGNLMVKHDRPARVLAVLDWEMGAIGDPRADVGYLLATYAEPGGEPSPLGASPVTALEGFPTRAELVERYVEAERPRGRRARLVRGACALEGGRVLRGDLRPVHCAASSGRRTHARRLSNRPSRVWRRLQPSGSTRWSARRDRAHPTPIVGARGLRP